MNFFPFSLALSLAAVSAASAASPNGAPEFFAAAPPGRVTTVAAAPAPLRFDHAPLGNVIRVLSARYSAPVTLALRAKSPITGDFSGLGFRPALSAIAAQAGLVATPLGADDRAGYLLALPVIAASEPGPKASSPPNGTASQAALAIASRQREQLLQRRQLLLDAAAQLQQ